MGRNPCCNKDGLNKGAWTVMEDRRLVDYVMRNGDGKWRNLPKEAGLKRCGKSCRLRWLNYLRPDIKRGNISPDEEDLIIRLHRLLGNKWSLIAGRLPGRTDNEIKNYWNTNLSKKLGSNKNHIKQQQKRPQQHNSTQFSIKKDDESLLTRVNLDQDHINSSSTHKYDKRENSGTLDEGELDMDFNLDEIINFPGYEDTDKSVPFNNIVGAGLSNTDEQHSGFASLVHPECNFSLHGEISYHPESTSFTSLFDEHWQLDEYAWGCL